MVHGNSDSPCDDGDQSAVGVAEDQQSIGLMFGEHRLDPSEQLPQLGPERIAPDPEVEIRVADPQLLKEHFAQVGVEVLARVHQDVIRRLVEQRDEPREPNDLRTRPEDGHQLHRST